MPRPLPTAGRAVRDEYYIGRNLGAEAQPVEGIGTGGRDTDPIPRCDGLGNLLHGRQNDASAPAFIDTGITIDTLRYAREDAVFTQADEG